VKYFVTGATGFIGGRLVRCLRENGHDVVALARNPDKTRDLVDLGVTVCRGDITDRSSLKAPMLGVDGVFHVAAWYKLGAPDYHEAQTVNVEGTRNVLETVRDLGIPKCVYTSTLAVFGDTHGKVADETYKHKGAHLSVYDRTKWMAHYDVALPLMEAGTPIVIVQPGLTYGPGDTSSVHTSIVDYLAGRLPVLPSVTAFCWAHVDDAVHGHLLAMEKGTTGESYIIAGPVHTLIGAFEMAQRVTGVPAPRIRPTPGIMNVMASTMHIVEKMVRVPETYSSEALRVMAGATYLGSSAKAEAELGFTARPLEDGWPETLRYEQEMLKRTSPAQPL